MEVVREKDKLHEMLDSWRHQRDHVALVPTMGNLHAGHLSLVELAAEHAERVVVSVFVNPTQFGEGEDYDDYPRTLERDTRRLRKIEADVLFVPTVETVYPFGPDNATLITVPELTQHFCGASRPGHFDGVATVVCKLFNQVQPDMAFFGEKDFQQLVLIRRMVRDLAIPVDVIAVPTVREPDGLAWSPRG